MHNRLLFCYSSWFYLHSLKEVCQTTIILITAHQIANLIFLISINCQNTCMIIFY